MQNAMSQPLIVSVPHRLGRQEARRRLDRGIGRLQPELGILLSGLNYHWQGDTPELHRVSNVATSYRPDRGVGRCCARRNRSAVGNASSSRHHRKTGARTGHRAARKTAGRGVGNWLFSYSIAISRLIMRRMCHPLYRTRGDGSRRHTGMDRCGVRRACALGIVRIAERIDGGNQ